MNLVIKLILGILAKAQVYTGTYVFNAVGQQTMIKNFSFLLLLIPICFLFHVAFDNRKFYNRKQQHFDVALEENNANNNKVYLN